jgi:hypothetical protein
MKTQNLIIDPVAKMQAANPTTPRSELERVISQENRVEIFHAIPGEEPLSPEGFDTQQEGNGLWMCSSHLQDTREGIIHRPAADMIECGLQQGKSLMEIIGDLD